MNENAPFPKQGESPPHGPEHGHKHERHFECGWRPPEPPAKDCVFAKARARRRRNFGLGLAVLLVVGLGWAFSKIIPRGWRPRRPRPTIATSRRSSMSRA